MSAQGSDTGHVGYLHSEVLLATTAYMLLETYRLAAGGGWPSLAPLGLPVTSCCASCRRNWPCFICRHGGSRKL